VIGVPFGSSSPSSAATKSAASYASSVS